MIYETQLNDKQLEQIINAVTDAIVDDSWTGSPYQYQGSENVLTGVQSFSKELRKKEDNSRNWSLSRYGQMIFWRGIATEGRWAKIINTGKGWKAEVCLGNHDTRNPEESFFFMGISNKWKRIDSDEFNEILSTSKMEGIENEISRLESEHTSLINNQNFKGADNLISQIEEEKDIWSNLFCEYYDKTGREPE